MREGTVAGVGAVSWGVRYEVSTEVCGRERGTRVEENGPPVPRSIEGWEEGFVIFIYPPVFIVS